MNSESPVSEETMIETPITTELAIVIKGNIVKSNFSKWKVELLQVIESSKKELKTDQDFATAEVDVKNLKESENQLQAAKIAALDQAAEINKLFSEIDEVSETAREARLELNSQITERKKLIRAQLIAEGLTDFKKTFEVINPLLVEQEGEELTKSLESCLFEATKGKRKLDSIQTAIAESVKQYTCDLKVRDKVISTNVDLIEAYCEKYPALFQDKDALACSSQSDELKIIIKTRIEAFKKQQADNDAAADAQKRELELRREIDEKKRAESEALEPPQENQNPPAMAKSSNGDNEAPLSDKTFQITITSKRPQPELVAMAKYIKERYSPLISEIRLFEV